MLNSSRMLWCIRAGHVCNLLSKGIYSTSTQWWDTKISVLLFLVSLVGRCFEDDNTPKVCERFTKSNENNQQKYDKTNNSSWSCSCDVA